MTRGDRLKKLRANMNKTLDEVGKALTISKQNLFKYENDIITNIPSDKIEQLAAYYGVSPSYIMGWDEPTTLAAHKDGEDWTSEELETLEMVKEMLRQKRKKKLEE